jgi:VWFA-related protein
MFRSYKLFCLTFLAIALTALPFCVFAQQQNRAADAVGAPPTPAALPTPSPTPSSSPQDNEDSIKVFTEEVRIPVFAFDDYGNSDRTIEPDDLLILEDGVPQTVRSVRHTPANVLLLLDTGGEGVGTGGVSKSTSLTREAALHVIAGLHKIDRLALIQFADHAETLQNWTTDRQALAAVLKWKLHSGKRARLAEAIAAAAQIFKDMPEGNRHVVLITDGVETSGSNNLNRADPLKQLNAGRVTVHVISYTKFVLQKQSDKTKAAMTNEEIRRRESIAAIANAGINPNPVGQSFPSSAGGGGSIGGSGRGFTFDPAMTRLRKAYEADVRRSEQWLTNLALETGGRIWLPVTAQEMLDEGGKVARDIGAQYVVTYKPKRPFITARAGEYRRLEIAPRKLGITLRTRRGYVTTPPSPVNTKPAIQPTQSTSPTTFP